MPQAPRLGPLAGGPHVRSSNHDPFWKFPKKPATALGVRLRHLREHLGLDQRAMATRVGTKQNRISDYELGYHVPTFAVLIRYAEACGMSVAQMLDGIM